MKNDMKFPSSSRPAPPNNTDVDKRDAFGVRLAARGYYVIVQDISLAQE